MNNDMNTLYKLIILDMLGNVDFALTNTQICNFFLDQGYTNYFIVQNLLSELIETGLIHQEGMQDNVYYTSTPEGEQAVGFFAKDISAGIRNDIKQYLKENKLRLRNESSVRADYYRNTAGEISVRCRVKEKNSDLIDLTVSVPDEAQAKAICRQWQSKCQKIYEYVMTELMTN